MKTYGKHELLVIRWRDAHHDFDSEDGKPSEDYIVHTCGFYVTHNETFLSIAQEILPGSNGYRGASHIPLVVIQSINGEKV